MATSTVHRAPAPSEDSRPEDSRPEKDFSLQGRLQAALAPEATDSERDALLYAISRPLAPEASAREHADFLLSLLSEERSRTLAGSNGRTVKKAATQALLALGYPYALEIPPEVLEQSSGNRSLRKRRRWGTAFSVANAVGPAIAFIWLGLKFGHANDVGTFAIILAILGASTLLPTLLILLGHKIQSLWLRVIGSVVHILSGLPVGGFALLLLKEALSRPRFIELLLGVGGLCFCLVQLGSTYLLQASQGEEE